MKLKMIFTNNNKLKIAIESKIKQIKAKITIESQIKQIKAKITINTKIKPKIIKI